MREEEPKREHSFWICTASSRVGARHSTMGPSPGDRWGYTRAGGRGRGGWGWGGVGGKITPQVWVSNMLFNRGLRRPRLQQGPPAR